MNKKNSIVLSHKNCFKKFKQISELYNNFKKKIESIKTKSFLIATSGGPDSLALVALCKALKYEKNNYIFFYININHGIRKNSFNESLKLKSMLKKYEIDLKVINNRKTIKNNIQHNARKIRYDLLYKECLKNNIKYILTAHHRDDQIETFLIRLSRGSGLQGLSSMEAETKLNKSVKIYRPFLHIKKSDLKTISKKVFGTYLKDPSNKNYKFLRVKVRKLLPILRKYGIEEEQIIKSIDNLQSTSNTIKFYFDEIYRTIITKKSNKYLIKKSDFYSFNEEIKLKILGKTIRSLTKTYYPPRSKKLKNAIIALNAQGLKLNYNLSGCLISQNENSISIKKVVKS